MSLFRGGKSRTRLIALNGLLFALLFAVIQLFLYIGVKAAILSNGQVEAEQIATAYAEQSHPNWSISSTDEAEALLRSVKTSAGIYVTIVSADDKMIATTRGRLPEVKSDSPLIRAAHARKPFLEQNTIYAAHAMQDRNGDTAYVVVEKVLLGEMSVLHVLLNGILLCMAIGLPASICAGLIASYPLAKSVRSLVDDIRSIDPERPSAFRHSKDESDDLATIRHVFAELLRRFQEDRQVHLRFVNDASHELRTPLALLSGYADSLLRRGEQDPEFRQQATQAIHDQARRMGKLVEQLLFLARSETNYVLAQRQLLDLATMWRDEVERLQLLVPDRTMTFTAVEEILYVGEETLLRQLLLILLDNAVKYTQPSGQIEVTVFKEFQTIKLVVKDNGIGIQEKARSRIFERFYRVDAPEAEQKQSYGLGLSIAKEIVRIHGGTIAAESEWGRGTSMVITFPELAVEN